MNQKKPMISRTELAEFLGVTLQTLRDWEREGHGPTPIRLSTRRTVYDPDEVDAFLEEQRVEPNKSNESA